VRTSTLKPGRRGRLGSRRTAAVALDIGADAVVALQAAGDGGRVRRAIVHPIPVGLVVDGEVVDPAGLAYELRALFDEHKLPRDVRVGLAHPRLMVRLVDLPATIDGGDLDGAVRHLATDLLPVGLDRLVVDYRRTGRVPGSIPGGMQRILMAAARVDGIERLTNALDAAGLRTHGIALSGLAMVSALAHDPLPGKAILYVQAGALTNVVITENGEPRLVRAASAGSESIIAALAERAGITHESARAHVSTLGLAPPPPPTGPRGLIPDPLEEIVAQQIREGLRRVAAEVQSSRGVYAARPDAIPIGGVVLTGAMTTWPGVAEALEHDLHLPVLAASRVGWPKLDDVGVAPERLDVVVGLARTGDSARPDLRPPIVAPTREASALTTTAQASCAMLALLAAAIVYLVVISNQASAGRDQLGQIKAGLAAAERAATALKPYNEFASATRTRRAAIASVAGSRFNWDRAFTELAEVAPAGIWLTSVKATLTPQTAVEGGAADATTGTLRGQLAVPALELSGCARREALVPAYIDRLQSMTGVTDVAFSRSERVQKDPGTTGATDGGDCRTGDAHTARFSLVVYFEAGATQTATATTAAPATSTAPAAESATAQNPASGSTTSTTPTAPSTQTASAATRGSR
jgi:type IV pilus assembly protein PilM